MRINNKKKKYLIISVFAILLFSTTVAFAALSGTLIVSGNVNKKGGTWNVGIDNPTVYEEVGSGKSQVVAVTDSTTLNMSVSLTQPGDSVTYTFDVVNNGTLNAQLYSWYFSDEFESFAAQYDVEATLTYADGTALKSKEDILKPSEKSTMKLKFKYVGSQSVADDDIFTEISIKLVYSQEHVA